MDNHKCIINCRKENRETVCVYTSVQTWQHAILANLLALTSCTVYIQTVFVEQRKPILPTFTSGCRLPQSKEQIYIVLTADLYHSPSRGMYLPQSKEQIYIVLTAGLYHSLNRGMYLPQCKEQIYEYIVLTAGLYHSPSRGICTYCRAKNNYILYLPQTCIILSIEACTYRRAKRRYILYLPQACIILPVEVEEDIPEEEGTCSINGF